MQISIDFSKRIPSLLSFCLPGLGQLSQQRYPWAVGIFSAFIFCILVLGFWWLIPFMALAAGFETFRSSSTGAMREPSRRTAYGAVAALGFLAWASYVAIQMLPVRYQVDLTDDIGRIRAVYRRCHALPGMSEEGAMECFQRETLSAYRDPWGTHYDIGAKSGVFEIRSAGPDRMQGTADDLVYPLFLRDGQTE